MKKVDHTIAVIGIGTGGILSLSHLCTYLPSNWKVVSIYDSDISILGVGESAVPKIPTNFAYGLGFNFVRDAEKLNATMKMGTRWLDWRKEEFNNPIPAGSYALHFDNDMLSSFALKRLAQRWSEKFHIMKGNVQSLENSLDKVKVKVNGKDHFFDYVVDCRGFPDSYADYTMLDLPLNYALVTWIKKPINLSPDWTSHLAHKNGWMFGIPLRDKYSWGYMFNDNITSRDSALKDMCSMLKLEKDNIPLKEYSFVPYHANKMIEGRIIKNGNRFLFYEPMEGLSGNYYSLVNEYAIDYIRNESSEDECNRKMSEDLKGLNVFLSFAYHGGSIYDTKFWKMAQKMTAQSLKDNDWWYDIKSHYQEHKKDPYLSLPGWPWPGVNWYMLDMGFRYKYFTESFNQGF